MSTIDMMRKHLEGRTLSEYGKSGCLWTSPVSNVTADNAEQTAFTVQCRDGHTARLSRDQCQNLLYYRSDTLINARWRLDEDL